MTTTDRQFPISEDPVVVLGGEIRSLRAELTDLRSTLLARGSAVARYARVYRAANQSINTATATAVSFDTEAEDAYGMREPGNPTRLVLSQLGRWRLLGQVTTATAAGDRAAVVHLNGVQHAIAEHPAPAAVAAAVQVVDEVLVTALTDYVELIAYQSSGGALDVLGGAALTFLSAYHLGAA